MSALLAEDSLVTFFSLIFQKFDPNFNPVKIGAAISTSQSTESILNDMFVTHLDEKTTTDIPDDYINAEEPNSTWDSSSTGSYMDPYFLSEMSSDKDYKHTDTV